MNTEDIKKAFSLGTPIIYNGIEYECISALIYRKAEPTGIKIQIELKDRAANSVTIAEPSRAEIKEAGL